MLFTAIATLTQDAPSRFNLGSLSAQQRMELFLSDFSEKDIEFLKEEESGDFKDLCKWRGVECEDQVIKKVSWGQAFECDDETKVDLAVIPATVTTFQVEYNNLCGEFRAESLPQEIVRFDISGNHFTGSVVTSSLPRSLVFFFAVNCKLSGHFDFLSLPSDIQVIALSQNDLSGVFYHRGLPKALSHVYLQGNKFEGSIDVYALPASLVWLDLRENPITGEKDMYVKER